MADTWVHEFNKRITWVMAPDHFRHGFIGKVTAEGDDDSWDQTYGDTITGHFRIVVDGTCPCGDRVYVESDGMYESAELLRAITSPHIAEDMARDTNPFEHYDLEKGEPK